MRSKGIHEIGLKIASVLKLKERYRDEDTCTYETTFGFKSPEGLYHTIRFLMLEGEKKFNVSDKEKNYWLEQHNQDLI